MIQALLLPTLLLMVAAVLVTRLLEHVVPETIAGLVVLAGLASAACWAVASALFGAIYILQAAQIAAVLGTRGGLGHLLALGGKAALIWLPLVLITVATAPRRWKTNTW